MTHQPSTEDRHYPRVKHLNLVQVDRRDDEGLQADLATGRTLDISPGGIRLELHHPLPLRTIVEMSLALDNDLVDVRGKVVYLEEIDDERCAMGIQFIDVGAGARQLLERYVEKAGHADAASCGPRRGCTMRAA